MKKSVKFISVFLSVIMLVSAFVVPVSAFAQDNYVRGIDVSEHNKNVDFDAIKSDGYDFAMIRLGYSDKYIDKLFYKHVENAVSAGMYFGVYLYSYAYNTEQAKSEAKFLIKTLETLNPTYRQKMILPVAYDLEDKTILDAVKKLDKDAKKKQLTEHALVFSDAVRKAGYTPMVYSNLNWLKNYLDGYRIYENDIKIWYANWDYTDTKVTTQVDGTEIPCYMLQHKSTVNDATKGLDHNVLFDLDPNNNSGSIEDAANTVIDCSKAKVTLSKTKYAYDGKVKKPGVNVYDKYGNKLPSSAYKVKYSSSANPGKKTVTVTFKGNYKGTVKAYFNIVPKKQTLSSVKSPSRKKVTVKWKKDKTVSGYQIQYSTTSKFTKNKKSVNVSKNSTSKTLKTVQYNKKYYVRIRAYKTIDGKKVYGSWSSTKSVKVK